MNNIDRAAEVVAREYATPDLWKSTVDPSVLIAQALADATPPLLMPDPQIVRTVEEQQALDPDTLLMSRKGYIADAVDNIRIPAVVVATAEQVRAARKALEEA